MAGLSTAELEEAVSVLVKTSQHNKNCVKAIKKPFWWPRALAFCYPLKKDIGIDLLHWRAILQNIIVKSYNLHNRNRVLRKLRPRTRTNKSTKSEKKFDRSRYPNSPDIFPNFSRQIVRIRRNSTSSSIGSSISTKSSGSSGSNFDTKVKKNKLLNNSQTMKSTQGIKETCNVNSEICAKIENFDYENEIAEEVTGKDGFLSYFGLSQYNMNNNNSIGPKCEDSKIVHKTSHPINLLNCPHVPFSSNVGLKLIKERNDIPQEIHERRIERNERFLNSDNFTFTNSCTEDFKINYNKQDADVELNHFYIFPTKKYHRPGKLTPKSKYLLKTYCRPLYIRLVKLENLKFKNQLDRELYQKNLQAKSRKSSISKNAPTKAIQEILQKENIQNYVAPNSGSFSCQTPKALELKYMKTVTVSGINASVVLKPINHLYSLDSRRNSNEITNDKESFVKVAKLNHDCCPRRASARLKFFKTDNNKPLALL